MDERPGQGVFCTCARCGTPFTAQHCDAEVACPECGQLFTLAIPAERPPQHEEGLRQRPAETPCSPPSVGGPSTLLINDEGCVDLDANDRPAATPTNPFSLQVIAMLHFIGGIMAMIDIYGAAVNGRFYPDLGVLGLFSGPGLLHHSKPWRNWTLFWLSIGILAVPFFAVWVFVSPQSATLTFFGQKVAYANSWVGLSGVVVAFVAMIWELRVLTSTEVKHLFGLSSSPGRLYDAKGGWHGYGSGVAILLLHTVVWLLVLYSALAGGQFTWSSLLH